MDGKNSKIDMNASSIVGLKAELFRKQEALKKERLQNASSYVRPTPSSKKPNIWSKKNAGVQSRIEMDKQQLTSEEEDSLAKSQSVLAAKAKLYEKLTSGQSIPDETTSELFLVDFEKKAIDKIQAGSDKTPHDLEDDGDGVMATVPTRDEMMKTTNREEHNGIPPPATADEEWVDYVDTLGRSRRCMRKDVPSLINMDKDLNPDKFREQEKKDKLGEEKLPDLLSEDMYREMLRKKWEKEEEEAAKRGPGPTHYQNVKFDEVREMGVGYFDFSKDELQRQDQMESLQMLRDETVDQRAKREQLKAKRKAAMQARLAKVKQRKKLKGEIPSMEDEDKDMAALEKKKDPLEERLASDADKSYDLLMGREKTKMTVREWDIGKEEPSMGKYINRWRTASNLPNPDDTRHGLEAWEVRAANEAVAATEKNQPADRNLWEEAKKKARDERLSEFAPPTTYFNSTSQKQPPKPQTKQEETRNVTNLSKNEQQYSSTTFKHSNSGPTNFNASNSTSETDFTYLSSGGFQAFQTTRKPKTALSTRGKNLATSTVGHRLATPRSHLASPAVPQTHPVAEANTSDMDQKKQTFVNEESIKQSLSFFRKQSEKD